MALFSFGKKIDSKTAPGGAPGSPIEQIMAMQQQGLDNSAIAAELQKQGYSSQQITDSLNQGMPAGPAPEPFPPGAVDPMMQPDPNMPMGMPPADPMPAPAVDDVPLVDSNKEVIEEVAEAIIDEKWKEFEEDIAKIIEWKDQTESKITQIQTQMQDLHNSVNSLHKNLLNKISEYDRNIVDVGTEIKAMEKVFQKVLPSLTENVNKLERMSETGKPKK